MAWSASPTTMMLRCSSASMRTSSHWATLVSWNSSTSTWANLPRHDERTSGWLRKRLTAEVSRSSKSRAEASISRFWYSAKTSASFLSYGVSARSSISAGPISSFLAAEMAAWTWRGGRRFGSRLRSRRM